MGRYVLAIDQGTTSSRALLFDAACQVAGVAQKEFTQHFPRSGWVEHDAEEIWASVLTTARAAIAKAGGPQAIVGIGISNQRETSLVWERDSGRPIHNAIVWQDRRTADACETLRAAGHEPLVSERTGLLLDPYFSATKIAWILDHVPGARERADARRARLRHHRLLFAVAAHRRAACTRPTSPTLRAPACSISAPAPGTTTCCAFSACRARMLPEVRDNACEFGETERADASARRYPFAAWPAISRRRPLARRASRRAC